MLHENSFVVVKEFTDKGKTTREVIAKGVTKKGFIDAYTEKGCVMRGGENPHFEDIYSGVIYKLESHFEQGGQVDRERDIEIAKTILMQLGGSNRLQMFTGAYNFVAVPYGVSFRIKNRSVNYVKIVLNAMDTYDIEFGRISGVNYKIVKELSGIYNDQLVEVFTRYTGMVLRLRKGGSIQGEENAEMVMNQNLQIRHHTEELEEILKSGKEVPAWVVSKISRAADSMSDATHYLEGTPDKMARGGNPRMVDISKLKTYVLTYIPVFDIKRAMQIKQKAVYAESEEDAIAQLPRTAKVISIKVASGGNRGIPQQQNRRKPSLSQQIRNEIKALKEMLPLLEGKDKKQVQDAIENLEETLDEMRAEGQYAEGGGVGEFSSKEYDKPRGKTTYDVEVEKDDDDGETIVETYDNYDEAISAYERSKYRFPITWRTYLETQKPPFVYEMGIVLSDGTLAVQYRKGKEVKYNMNGNEIYAKGGGIGTHIDLFEDYENMPPKIAKIFDKYSKDFEDGNYKGLSMALKEMQQFGYTFEYGLDGQAYGLRPIGVPLNQLKGYEGMEEDYADGGGVGEFPTKGELTNKDNFLLKYEKKGGDYEFYIYKPETKKVSAYNQVEHICINSDFPYKMSYQQFINYLYAELYLDGMKYAKGGEIFVCPVGTQIQTLIFDKSMFNLRQAKAWAKKNNFENDFVDGKLNTFRIRQKDPAMFTEDGFRTIQLRQGVQAVIGCPKKRTIRRKK